MIIDRHLSSEGHYLLIFCKNGVCFGFDWVDDVFFGLSPPAGLGPRKRWFISTGRGYTHDHPRFANHRL